MEANKASREDSEISDTISSIPGVDAHIKIEDLDGAAKNGLNLEVDKIDTTNVDVVSIEVINNNRKRKPENVVLSECTSIVTKVDESIESSNVAIAVLHTTEGESVQNRTGDFTRNGDDIQSKKQKTIGNIGLDGDGACLSTESDECSPNCVENGNHIALSDDSTRRSEPERLEDILRGRYNSILQHIPDNCDKTLSLLQLHFEHEAAKGDSSQSLLSNHELSSFLDSLNQQLQDENLLLDRTVKITFSKLNKVLSVKNQDTSKAVQELQKLADIVRPLDMDLTVNLIEISKKSAAVLNEQDIVLFLGGTGKRIAWSGLMFRNHLVANRNK